jgi:amino acid adenylation domain-containing protein
LNTVREVILMTNRRFPLTLPQRDIYFDQLRHKQNPFYNVGGYIDLHRIDAGRLIAAHEKLVRQCEIFGLRILSADDGIYQEISASRSESLPVLDFSSAPEPSGAFESWVQALFETPLEVHQSELFRTYLVKLAEDHHRYVGVTHHLMMDGWGFSNWARLLAEFYQGVSHTDCNPLSWREVAENDEKYLKGERYKQDKAYWAEHIGTAPAALLSPRYRHQFADPEKIPGFRRIIIISREEFRRIRDVAASVDAGVPHHLLAMLAVYFFRNSGQARLIFGLPFHNRSDHRRKQMLGVFTSISPILINIGGGQQTFGELVRSVCAQQKSNLRHQRYPLGHILRDLPDLGNSRSIYDIAFNYLKLDSDLCFSEQQAELVYLSHNHETTPLMVTLCEYGDHGPVELRLDCNLAYFKEEEIARLAERFSFLLKSLVNSYATPVPELGILPEHELQQLLRFAGHPPAAPPGRCIHQLFEAQVAETPDAIAVRSAEEVLTYQQLNVRANCLANYLVRLGVQPDSLVGVFLERSADMVVAVLGILKAGGAYLPLDHSYPSERARLILEDADVKFVLTHQYLAGSLPASVYPVTIDQLGDTLEHANPDPLVLGLTPLNLAYVIYTSGSTGKPKGVQICHFNTVTFLEWACTVFDSTELERVLASTSLTFDLSVFEIFAPLSVGGECVVAKDALELLENKFKVSLINTVPSAIKMLIEQQAVPDEVRVVNLAGEALPMQVVNDLISAGKCNKVFNLYGPSEDTTYSTCFMFDHTISETPNIGTPIAGTQAYVLTPEGTLAMAGAVGELHLAGLGLARGYLNRPDLTAERFIPNPFSGYEGGRLYRTGDLVRYRTDGVLEYVGRTDDQVKIRGFRIEPGEIQKQLERLNEVQTAVVLVRERTSSEKYLAAYVERKRSLSASGSAPEVADEIWANMLQNSLKACLPEYMVPTIAVVNEMPLTQHGKIDKKALLALDAKFNLQGEYIAPATATEVAVADLWADLLSIDRRKIGANTSLFDFGGHSLLLVKLANALRTKLGVKLSLRILFEARDLKGLSAMIDAEAAVQRMEEKMDCSVIMSEGYL